MVIVQEFLPNPVGKDAPGEYVALFNGSDASVNLSGWKLKDASGKIFSLNGYTIAPQKDLKFFSSVTKLSLNNNGETIRLVDPAGAIADELSYVGSAQEGRIVYADRTITPELRAELFDPLAASTLNTIGGFPGEAVATGVLTALLLAIVSALVLNKVHHDKGNPQERSDAGWSV